MNLTIKKNRSKIYLIAAQKEFKKLDSAREYLCNFTLSAFSCMGEPFKELILFNDVVDTDVLRDDKSLTQERRILCLLLCREMSK